MRAIRALCVLGAVLIFGWAALLWPDIYLGIGIALMAPGAALVAIELYERSMQP